VSRSSEFCRHNPLCCFSTSVYCCKRIFRYRPSPETFRYTHIYYFYNSSIFDLQFSLNPGKYFPEFLPRALSVLGKKKAYSKTYRFRGKTLVINRATSGNEAPAGFLHVRYTLLGSSHSPVVTEYNHGTSTRLALALNYTQPSVYLYSSPVNL
jgi:hypothetical protein